MIGLIEGRAVHYVGESGEHYAATIVHVHSVNGVHTSDGKVNLFVPPRNASEDARVAESVSFSTRKHIGTWHWPERVEA